VVLMCGAILLSLCFGWYMAEQVWAVCVLCATRRHEQAARSACRVCMHVYMPCSCALTSYH
jgi:hypothetical protein